MKARLMVGFSSHMVELLLIAGTSQKLCAECSKSKDGGLLDEGRKLM
jgi:hypothetical protein